MIGYTWVSVDSAAILSCIHERTTSLMDLIDVMDGHFVPNITMGAPILSAVRDKVPGIYMDCHMMVSDPLKVS